MHDFGTVRCGEIKKHEFVFSNTGDAVLEIEDVRRSCGCTATGEWTRRVEPGGQGKIPIEYHSANDKGLVTKSVTVVCNAVDQTNVVLQVKADVWKPFELEPQAAMLKVLADSPTNAVAKVRITNRMDQLVTLSEPRSSHKALAGELNEIRPGKEYEVTVRMVPPVGLGNVYGKITLKTSYAPIPTLEVPVYALLEPALSISPSLVNLASGPLTGKTTHTVTIRSNSRRPLVLSDVSFDVEGGAAELTELEPGRAYRVSLTFPAGYDLPVGKEVAVRVKSNYPETPVIRVPVRKAVTALPSQGKPAAPVVPSSLRVVPGG